MATKRCISKSTTTGNSPTTQPNNYINQFYYQTLILLIILFYYYYQAGSQPPAPLQVLKPNELFSKILPLLKDKGLTEQTPRKDWPHSVQLRVLKELLHETPNDLLGK